MQLTKAYKIAEIRGRLDAIKILSQFTFFQDDKKKLLKEKKELEEELEELKRDWGG